MLRDTISPFRMDVRISTFVAFFIHLNVDNYFLFRLIFSR